MGEKTIKRTPLDAAIARKIGSGGVNLCPEELAAYQLVKLRETIEYACLRSPFYRKKLGEQAQHSLTCLADMDGLSLTTSEELSEEGLQFLCVSQDEISRVVTLSSSGTTGTPKRVFFTADDQELAVDFFRTGTANLVEKGDHVLVLLPGETPGSVGDLLASGIDRFGAVPVRHGMIRSLPEALDRMIREGVISIIGLPVQVFALARYAEAMGIAPRLKSVALVSDHVPGSIVDELKRIFRCAVFQHYGATEMGLGGGVDCEAHAGYHLREADLYFEIVDPQTGKQVRDGEPGEVVFTTLTRRGMPLIRYRTGDSSKILAEPCSCGSVLRRLETLKSRGSAQVAVPEDSDGSLTMAMLDEVLFKVPGLIDFDASISQSERPATLTISARSVHGSGQSLEREISEALDNVHAIYLARRAGSLTIHINARCGVCALEPEAGKRTITEQDRNGEQGRISHPAWQNSAGR
jgi:phenylacetate-coenzyme A ligase PaaK-like adenylate-forming protein